MAESRFQVDDEWLAELRSDLNAPKAKLSDLTREAFTLLKWAAEERKEGRVILSGDAEGHKLTRLAMSILKNVKPNAKKPSAQAD